MNGCSPGEKMSGLKRMSNDVLLMEPTALQAFRTTSRLLGSEGGSHNKEPEEKILKETKTNIFNCVHNKKCKLELLQHACKKISTVKICCVVKHSQTTHKRVRDIWL